MPVHLPSLKGSVGRWERGARNRPEDVLVVQRLLTAIATTSRNSKFDPRGIDGRIARLPSRSGTVLAIEAFQKGFVPLPDGVIDVDGKTWKKLLEQVLFLPAARPLVASKGPFFPLATVPAERWTDGMRAFGASRSGGKRAHAGCDLYAKKGDWIYAIGKGKVTAGPYPFYAQTDALEIDHGTFHARYGEILKGSALVKAGDVVEPGQRICKVGHLVGINVPSDMLHLELYSNPGGGRLTVDAAHSAKTSKGVPYFRRADVIDPSPLLAEWSKNLPVETK